MQNNNLFAGKLFCPHCGKAIPESSSKCTNPNCPSNQPIKRHIAGFHVVLK